MFIVITYSSSGRGMVKHCYHPVCLFVRLFASSEDCKDSLQSSGDLVLRSNSLSEGLGDGGKQVDHLKLPCYVSLRRRLAKYCNISLFGFPFVCTHHDWAGPHTKQWGSGAEGEQLERGFCWRLV